MDMKEKFLKATENSQLRQSFLESIPLEGLSKMLWKVQYVSKEPSLHSILEDIPASLSMRVKPSFATMKGYRLTKQFILVYPPAFDKTTIKDYNEFSSCLFDHECFHVREYYDRPEEVFGNFPRELLQSMREDPFFAMELLPRFVKINLLASEIRALHNQIGKAQERDLSEAQVEKYKKRKTAFGDIIKFL